MTAVPQVPNHIGNYKWPFASNTETGITAHAGGNQTSAYQLTAQSSVVSTVASGNDSVKLPKIVLTEGALGSVGTILFLTNSDPSNSMQVFGSSPDTINGVATGTGNAISAGVCAILIATSYTKSTDVGTWRMINSTASAVAAFTSGTINGVAINNSPIGTATAAAGAFTTLTATAANLNSLNGTIVGSATAAAGTFTQLSSTATSIVGGSAGVLVGFYGGAGTIQTAQIATAVFTNGAVGFASTAQGSAAIDALNALSALVHRLGLTA